MRLIDKIEAAVVIQHSARPLDASMTLPVGTVLLIKAALLAGAEMADWIVSEDECGKGVASIALENADRFRAATEGTQTHYSIPAYIWKGDGPEPRKWTAPDGTMVYRSYGDYCDD